MKILVTGAAGFIGSHFVRYLLDNTEAAIVGLDRIDSAGDLNRLKPHERFVFVHHDLRAAVNDRVFRQLLTGKFRFDEHPFDYIVHMAAGSHVDRSVTDPVGFIQDNVVGTAHLLDMLRTRAALGRGSKVLYFSTDEVFGPAPYGVSFREWDRMCPNNPYAASKAGGELLCSAYANTYGLPILVTHCTNVFGEGQHREKFIPLIIDQIRRGQLVKIHSDGSRTVPASRFYTYVDNVSWAVLFLLRGNGECLDGTDQKGKYNISGDAELDNLTVARKVAELVGKELRYEMVDFCANRPRHDMRYAVDSSRLTNMAWQPIVSFDEGLRRVVESET